MNIEKLVALFQRPSPEQVASKMLFEARHTLLEAQGQIEYWQGMEQAMQKRIARLTKQPIAIAASHGATK